MDAFDYWQFGYKKGVIEHIHEAPKQNKTKQKYKRYSKIVTRKRKDDECKET